MNFRRLLPLFILAMGFLTVSSQTPVSVFITAGQSNAEGRASSTEKPEYLNKGYRHLKYAFVRSAQDGKFGKYQPGADAGDHVTNI